LAFGNPEAAWFLPALAVGALAQRWQARRRRRDAQEAAASDRA
jgi:hypothetical protein